MEHNNPFMNASYKPDPTAYEAIQNIEKKEKDRYGKFLGCLFRIAELSGFYIKGLVVVDNRCGKTYKFGE